MLTMPKKQLVAMLDRAATTAKEKSPSPVLKFVRITTDDFFAETYASNGFVASRTRTSAKTDGAGSAAVDAASLLDRVRSLDDGDVELKVDGAKISGRTLGKPRRFTLPSAHADDFPPVPSSSAAESLISMPASSFVHLLAGAKHAMGEDVARANTYGICLEIEEDRVTAIATDGRCMSVRSLPATTRPGGPILIPPAGVLELSKLGKGDADITVAVAGSTMFAKVDDAELAVQLSSGQFVEYRRVIPDGHVTKATVDRASLIDALRAVTIANTAIDFDFSATGSLSLASESTDAGSTCDELPCAVDGPGVVVRMNPQYVLRTLAAMTAAHAVIELGRASLEPVVFRDAETFTVVMPVHR